MVYISCRGFPKENTNKKEGLAKKRKNRVDKVDVGECKKKKWDKEDKNEE